MSYIYIPKPNLKLETPHSNTHEKRENSAYFTDDGHLDAFNRAAYLVRLVICQYSVAVICTKPSSSDSSPFANYFQSISSRPRDSLMSRTSDPGSGREACLVVPLLCSLFWLLVGASSLVCMSKFTGLAHVVALVVVKQLL